MIQFAFRRLLRLVALALCSATIAVAATPASARSHHGAGRHARAYHAGYHARWHHHRHFRHAARGSRHVARVSRWERGVAQMRAGGFADANASFSPNASFLPNASVDPNATLTPPGGV